MTREQIEAEIADLKAKNEATPGWGAAVGARSERIKGLEQALRAMDRPQCSAESCDAATLADKIAAWSPSSKGPLVFIARERRLIEDALRTFNDAQPAPDRDKVREMAAWLIALGDANDHQPISDSLLTWARVYVNAGLTEKHSGDCTDECHSCVVCGVSNYMEKAEQILKAFAAAPPPASPVCSHPKARFWMERDEDTWLICPDCHSKWVKPPAATVERPKCKLCGLEDGACICAHLPPRSSAATEDETGWLIEKDDPPVYCILSDDYDEHWTSDASKALRFARREDAQAYSDHIGWTSPPVRIAEHMWPVPRALSEPQPTPVNAAMAQFVQWAMREGAWSGCDLEGSEIQEEAERLGLLVRTKYDPEIHGESEFDVEAGDDWYVLAPEITSALSRPHGGGK